MKRKLLAVLLSSAMVFSLAACGNSDSESSDAAASAEASAEVAESADAAPEKPEYKASDYVELGEYIGIDVTAVQYEVTDEQYESVIENMLASNATYPEADHDTVEDGDRVDIDFVGTIDGEEFDGGSAEGSQIVIGSGTFIDNFEEQLIGAKTGDEVTVTVTFPDDYQAEDLAGQEAEFAVTINQILSNETVNPEYDDAFVNTYTGGEYTTTEDFDAYVREYLQDSADQQTQSELEAAIQEIVYDNSHVTGIPEGLLEYYVEIYSSQDIANAESNGMEFADYISQAYGYSTEEEYYSELESQLSENLIPNMLVQEAIIEEEGLEVDDAAIESFMTQYASYYGYTTVDEVLSLVGVEDIDGFIALVGEDDFNDAVLSVTVWNYIQEQANITYIPESEASGDAE